ncbi:MAG: ImmA/IrrE family metallo-endopeptidase [Phycisphaeraceae bacterium]|nr:MAG: ImmA/IrrE family metallo-endopeptidase [Phycisphaeraceae bacterium]
MDADLVASKLKTARRATGMSTRRVASLLETYGASVSHATVSAYERAASTPSIETLTALSELYRRSLDWFLSSTPALSGVQYRHIASRVKVADLAAFEASATVWLEAFGRLEAAMGMVTASSAPPRLLDPNASPQEAARKIRVQLGLASRQPVASVFEVLDALQVRSIELAAHENIDGLSAWWGDQRVVVLNVAMPNDRLRFDAAHEMFHLLLGDCDEASGPDGRARHDRAMEAASQFLITDDAVRDAFLGKSMVRLLQFKQTFGVSLAVLVFRGSQLGLINGHESKRLWIEFSKRGWRHREPGHVWADRPRRFEYLLDIARNVRGWNWRKLAETCGVPMSALRDRLSAAIGADEKPLAPESEVNHNERYELRLVR